MTSYILQNTISNSGRHEFNTNFATSCAILDSPSRIKLFNEIADFVHNQIGGDSGSPEPAQKRRRVDVQPPLQNGSASNGASATISVEDVAAENTLLEIKEISVSIPQRKKFDLCFTAKHLYARLPNTTAPIPGIIYAWKDIGAHTDMSR